MLMLASIPNATGSICLVAAGCVGAAGCVDAAVCVGAAICVGVCVNACAADRKRLNLSYVS